MIRDLTARLPGRTLRATILAAALAGAAAGATAEEFHLFPESPPGSRFADVHWVDAPGPLVDFEATFEAARLETTAWPALAAIEPSLALDPQPRPEKLFTTATTVWTAAAVAGGVLQGLGAPLQYGWQSWNTTDEGWFGRDTYTGGADKVSHFVLSSAVSRLLYGAYTYLGHPPNQSFNLALATAFTSGLMVEVMDAFSVYGFSFQDLAVDALGSAAGVLIQRNHLDDLLGLRVGLVETPIPADAIGSSAETLGRSYNDEIYAADLKLGGLVRRLNGKPGFERFFLTSFVFFTKGFGYDPPLPTRYQEIGFEVGLNFSEILRAFGVTEKTWWGQGLIAIFDFFRFPFTQVGVYYNLFDQKWYGPGAPHHYY
jgi:Predicted periplasmic lipoprotein (DUF2279)